MSKSTRLIWVTFLISGMAGTLLCLGSLGVVGAVGGYELSDFHKTANINHVGDYMTQYLTAVRHQRGATSATALFVKGNNALQLILRGAKNIPSRDSSTMMFQKAGNLESALKDFKATKPVPVSDGHRSFPFGPKINYMDERVYGQAGDRILKLEKYDKDTRKPVLTIMSKTESSHSYKVVYTQ